MGNVAIPQGPAFAIWGLIYSWELVFVVAAFFTDVLDTFLPALTIWFCLGQLMQGSWVLIFTRTDPASAGKGGDFWLWSSTLLLLVTPFVFIQCVAALKTATGTAYWLSIGIQINAAWVLLAASISINQAARGAGLEGAFLSAVAVLVLVVIVFLELMIVGLVGGNELQSPVAFFPVGVWALLWVFKYLSFASETDDHAKRILPLYGSNFILFYKWSSLVLAIAFVLLEVAVLMK